MGSVDSAPQSDSVVPQASNKQVMHEAQGVFDTLMDFGMSNPHIPQDILEAIDRVANYCGDIAKGRKVK